jgi:alginate O-acetyltransferase complex protein AlgJ
MTLTFASCLERTLVLLLALSFFLPLPLGWVLQIPKTQVPATAWLRNISLSGVQIAPAVVAPSRATILSARYQDAVARNYNYHFAGRELLIRLVDELYLRAFHRTFVDVVVGPNYALTGTGYAREYCLLRGKPDGLVELAKQLRRLQDFCDMRGIAFALLLTPSKSAISPETLPAAWLRRFRPEPRAYDQLLPLLRANGIRYVDGHRITAELKPHAPVPVFPLGGIHWGQPAALATANALLAVLASKGLNAQPIRDDRGTISNQPIGQDYDVANLINTVLPMHYPVETIAVQPQLPPRQNVYPPNIVFVGGSFVWNLLELLGESRQFSELEFYFYYRRSQVCQVDDKVYTIGSPAPPLNLETDIFAADALVLEANEETLDAAADHLGAFLHAALAALPDPHEPRSPFHDEAAIEYHWGETLSFAANQQQPPLNPAALSGFTPPGVGGAYTVGPLAALRMRVPTPTADMVLDVDAGAFLVDTRLPEQRVSVSANNHPIGEWVWRANTPPRHQLIIPKACLSNGRVRLDFHVIRPGSPAEFGLSEDTSKYGFFISTLRLHGVGK